MSIGTIIFMIGSIGGSTLSALYTCYILGNKFSRRSAFYQIAKHILTKIFNEIKDVDKIKELAEILKNKFKDKKLSELKKFILDLLDLEKKQKRYNFDKFFRDNREVIISNIENLKEYFVKRLYVEEFSIFIFARFYDCHIDIATYKDLLYGLMEDSVISVKITPKELLETLEQIYITTAEIDKGDFENQLKAFDNKKRVVVSLLDTMYFHELSRNKKRFIGFMKENIETMILTIEMIKGNVSVDLESANRMVEKTVGSSFADIESVNNSNGNSSIGSTKEEVLNRIADMKKQLEQF